MRFLLVDAVVERTSERIVALKHVAAAEEYLQDHFPTYPVLPGVLMLEAMVQAARALVAPPGEASARLVLGEARALKFGAFVRPGDTLRLEVDLLRSPDDRAAPDPQWRFRGKALALPPQGGEDVAAAGRFTLRRVAPAARPALNACADQPSAKPVARP